MINVKYIKDIKYEKWLFRLIFIVLFILQYFFLNSYITLSIENESFSGVTKPINILINSFPDMFIFGLLSILMYAIISAIQSLILTKLIKKIVVEIYEKEKMKQDLLIAAREKKNEY